MIIKSHVLGEVSVEDLRNLQELDESYFPFPWSRQLWERAKLNKDYFIFFDPQYHGFAIFLLSPLDKLAHLTKIVVNPIFRKKGHGTAILNASHSHFRVLGIERCILEVEVGNRSAIALYERLNYKKIHLKKNFYSNGADAHIMEKHL